ncbi:hypothetical protein BDQ17DRAFT_1352459 [Cyathus striatus]|nr:hypothetical protein BDQ17DRAFT_1352459 [Cyathus striatus]
MIGFPRRHHCYLLQRWFPTTTATLFIITSANPPLNMAPSKSGKTANSQAATTKKEKIHHPASRKAGQLARHALRKGKMGNLATKRTQKHDSMVDVYGFFYHAMPEEGALSLEELHQVVRNVWLARFDDELESEKAARRKGRPKSLKEMKMEEMKLREVEEYRTGLEVIDLTHPVNTTLFRRWDQKEAAYIQQLRFIRIFSSDPQTVVVSRPGKHSLLINAAKNAEESMDTEEDIPLLIPAIGVPVSQFSSTMMTMDGPLIS